MDFLKLCFILDAGTDVRLVESLAKRFELTLVGRQLGNGIQISQTTTVPMSTIVGPTSRLNFAQFVGNYLKNRKGEFDYVIVQNYGLTALVVNLAARFTKTPIAMLVCSPIEDYYRCRKHHLTPDKPFKWHELLSFQIIAWLNTIVGQRYIVLSQYLANVVGNHGNHRPVSIVPVYGVDTKIFVPSNKPKTKIKAKLNLPTTGSLIFFSSRIAPEKDSETLLIALQHLLKKGHDLWLLHRSGGYRTFIKEAKFYGVAERIIATDAVHPDKDLPMSYQACDLCVQSSREEGLGFSPLEALACGVPVVATSVGGLQETIIDGQTGWNYSVGDDKTLAKCIESILDNPDEAARRAAKGRELVCQKYDRTVVFEQLLKMIHNLI